jgi:hypothetical protein
MLGDNGWLKLPFAMLVCKKFNPKPLTIVLSLGGKLDQPYNRFGECCQSVVRIAIDLTSSMRRRCVTQGNWARQQFEFIWLHLFMSYSIIRYESLELMSVRNIKEMNWSMDETPWLL